jgi:arabinogalactan oligomer/maltooligosaccharide transport system substrate-binding protein
MRRRAKVWSVLAAAAFAGSAAGVAGATTEPPGTTEPAGTEPAGTEAAAEAPETTEFQPPERGDADLVIWTDDTRQPVIEEIAVPFAEENGIVIAVQELGFGDIREQLSLTAPTGEGPDIVIGAHDWLGELVANGVIAPLDISAIADGFNPVAVEAFTYDGQTYGLPYAVENIALVRNTDLVPEAPATFEEMIQIATEYQAANPDGVGLPLQIGPEGDAYHLQPILSAFGGYIFGQNEDGTFNPEDVGIDSEGGLAAATFLNEQVESGLLSPDYTYDTMIESFGSGNAPFVITGPWALTEADRGFDAMGVPYAVGAIPAREGGEPPAVFVGVQGFMISSFSEQADLATSFVLDYMSQESTQLALFEAGGRPPALTSAYEQVADDPVVAGFNESALNGIPQPAIPEMGNVWSALGLAEVNTLRGANGPEEFTAAAEQIRSAIAGG